MLEILRSERLSIWVACAIGFLGVPLGWRQSTVTRAAANLTGDRLQVAYLDLILVLLSTAIVGFLVGLGLTAVQRVVGAIDRVEDGRRLEAERWEILCEKIDAFLASTQTALNERAPATGEDPARRSAIDAIHRVIRDKEWSEADRLIETLRVEGTLDPDLDRLSMTVENRRDEAIQSQLERIKASQEVGDSERVLDLYQDVTRLLDPMSRKSLEDDLARWFMNHIQRRLRSGTIQAEVVTLTARVSEIFGGTAEGASLRAGLPTLRRTVGLCPRCGGPYVGASDACPVCLGAAAS
jgi:hypothetical protein